MSRKRNTLPGLKASTRVYQRGLRALTKTMLDTSQQVAKGAARQMRKAHAEPPRGEGQWLSGLAMGAGGARRYHLFVPPVLAKPLRAPAPLLVMLHGCLQNSAEFAHVTRMNQVARREGFMVLYPEQDVLHQPNGCWNWYDRRSGKAAAEAATLMAAVDQVCLLYRGDRERVAVAGLSAGAGMAALMATLYPGRFQAVAMHSGVAPGAAKNAVSAIEAMMGYAKPSPAAAVGKAMLARASHSELPPLLVIQGSRDGVVAPVNGERTAEVWAAASGADQVDVRTVQRGRRLPMRVTEFRQRRRLCVRWCEVEGLAHAWSGGSGSRQFSDPEGPDASAMIWQFAKSHFRVIVPV